MTYVVGKRRFESVLKLLSSLFNKDRPHTDEVDGNQERPLPQRWRDPAPKPMRRPPFGLRTE